MGVSNWVTLAELFVEERIALTEGVVSGSVVFVAAVQAHGTPPKDRDLKTWAEEIQQPWVEVVDNEIAYFGCLDEELTNGIIGRFLCERPLDKDWRQCGLSPSAQVHLTQGLFDSGWTRNCSLVKDQRRPTVDFWGGVNSDCLLDQSRHHPLTVVNTGVRCTLKGETWDIELIEEPCPLDDVTGRATPRVE